MLANIGSPGAPDLTRVDPPMLAPAPSCAQSTPQDKAADAGGQRRALDAPALSPKPASGIAPLLRQLVADYGATATGLPTAS